MKTLKQVLDQAEQDIAAIVEAANLAPQQSKRLGVEAHEAAIGVLHAIRQYKLSVNRRPR